MSGQHESTAGARCETLAGVPGEARPSAAARAGRRGRGGKMAHGEGAGAQVGGRGSTAPKGEAPMREAAGNAGDPPGRGHAGRRAAVQAERGGARSSLRSAAPVLGVMLAGTWSWGHGCSDMSKEAAMAAPSERRAAGRRGGEDGAGEPGVGASRSDRFAEPRLETATDGEGPGERGTDAFAGTGEAVAAGPGEGPRAHAAQGAQRAGGEAGELAAAAAAVVAGVASSGAGGDAEPTGEARPEVAASASRPGAEGVGADAGESLWKTVEQADGEAASRRRRIAAQVRALAAEPRILACLLGKIPLGVGRRAALSGSVVVTGGGEVVRATLRDPEGAVPAEARACVEAELEKSRFVSGPQERLAVPLRLELL